MSVYAHLSTYLSALHSRLSVPEILGDKSAATWKCEHASLLQYSRPKTTMALHSEIYEFAVVRNTILMYTSHLSCSPHLLWSEHGITFNIRILMNVQEEQPKKERENVYGDEYT